MSAAQLIDRANLLFAGMVALSMCGFGCLVATGLLVWSSQYGRGTAWPYLLTWAVPLTAAFVAFLLAGVIYWRLRKVLAFLSKKPHEVLKFWPIY